MFFKNAFGNGVNCFVIDQFFFLKLAELNQVIAGVLFLKIMAAIFILMPANR
ncbi:hypothetical protein GH811_18850 [Acetobacterium malicum]|uniref:Uncharacterized protein n=1 Tax=Acetobacterium malicum TaxID=52692 RepID=A0ABR6Z2G5_9FIRM|nr:hypothetical protein [Acetobacterium malicum]MBC3901660.1 hypothetical protein [Acetobacterium malicum]